ncbi:hypothetical protein [Clostridium beijerinckii]|nr:hypothetical protein [Clostridium beijerinckii]
MYDFIKNMWIMGKYTEINIYNCVDKAYITQEQANTIMTMEQATITTP